MVIYFLVCIRYSPISRGIIYHPGAAVQPALVQSTTLKDSVIIPDVIPAVCGLVDIILF